MNDDETPGGLNGPLPGPDFKIGHIEVEDGDDAGTEAGSVPPVEVAKD